jgi:glycosyltransferase involved in cell wall biosynthesis
MLKAPMTPPPSTSQTTSARRTRILFCCRTPLFGGGAVISLYRLLSRLDRERFEPMILAIESSTSDPYYQKFRDLDIEIIRLRDNDVVGITSEEEAEAQRRRHRGLKTRLSRVKQLLGPLKVFHDAWKWGTRFLREDWSRIDRVRRILEERDIDLLYLNDSFQSHRGDILAARRAGVRCLCHMRIFDRISFFDVRMLRSIDYLVSMSTAIEQHVKAKHAGAVGSVVFDGIDLNEYGGPFDCDAVRAEYGFGPDDFVVGNVGRLATWKGQHIFLQALARIAAKAPNLKGLIVGQTDPDHPEILDQLKAIAKEGGIEDRIVFTGFCLEPAALYASMDLNVHSAIRPEPFGLVVIETFAAGTPVVATRGGGPLDSVDEGVDGLLVPFKDPDAMGAAILEFYRDREKTRVMGQAGQNNARRRFSIERYVADMERIFDSLLEPVQSNR